MAPVIRALPPSATGQPTAWASAVSIRPTAPVGTARSGIMACAAAPANRARASGVRNRRATACRGPQAVDQPNTASPADSRARRPPDRGQQQLGQVRAVAGHRAEQPPVGGAVAAEARRGLRDRPGDHRGPAAVQRLGENHLRAGEGDAAGGQAETPEEG